MVKNGEKWWKMVKMFMENLVEKLENFSIFHHFSPWIPPQVSVQGIWSEGLLIKNTQLWLLRYPKDQQVPGKKLQFLAPPWVRSLVEGDTGRSNLCCRIELSWSPWFWAEFNDWLLACRVIRIIGPRSSISLLFIYKKQLTKLPWSSLIGSWWLCDGVNWTHVWFSHLFIYCLYTLTHDCPHSYQCFGILDLVPVSV